jgi:hypothetical protein
MGWSILCSLIKPLIVGADGFRFMYFHLWFLLIRVLLLLMVFLICFWYSVVGSVFVMWKLLLVMKLFILFLVLVGWEDDYGIAFVGCCHSGIIGSDI